MQHLNLVHPVIQVFFGDGYSYERVRLEEYVRGKVGTAPITHNTLVPSPRTGEMVQPIMIANMNLKHAIEAWQAHKKQAGAD